MIGSELLRSPGVRVVALLIVVLFAGCGQKTADVDRLLADAKQERVKGNNNVAIIQLKNALQAKPDDAAARLALGRLYLKAGDHVSAERPQSRTKPSESWWRKASSASYVARSWS